MSTATHDFVVVGAGLFGAVVAERLAAAGASVLLVEQHSLVGGLCLSVRHPVTGEHYCPYGTHLVATSDRRVWTYLAAQAPWVAFRHTVHSSVDGQLVPMPIGLAAIRACYGDEGIDAEKAWELIAADTAPYQQRTVVTVEDAALAAFGPALYEMFIQGYVTKQWGAHPAELSAAVLTDRFTIRYDDTQGYYRDARWQALPVHGYGNLFARLLASPRIDVFTGHTASGRQHGFRLGCVHTGPVDAFFDYRLGALQRRTIHLRWVVEPASPQPRVAVTTYPDVTVPHYRSHRPALLPWNRTASTANGVLVGYEHPGPPPHNAADTAAISFVTRTPANAVLAARYRRLARGVPDHVFAGRGTTFYHNMAATVGAALDLAADLARRHDLHLVEAR